VGTNENGQVVITPDILYINEKYQLLSGKGELNDDNLSMRRLSYCCMLGAD